jgi:FMN phosphatase YigB (HAD superfamily)
MWGQQLIMNNCHTIRPFLISKVHPSEAIFIDDLGSNLKAAQQMGIRTIKAIIKKTFPSQFSHFLSCDTVLTNGPMHWGIVELIEAG